MENTVEVESAVEEKRRIRAEMRALRRGVTPESARLAGVAIAARLDELAGGVAPGAFAACYLSMRDEVDSAPLIEWCRGRGLRVAVPASDGAGGYRWAELREGEPLATGPMGIPEPAEEREVDPRALSLALVPGVAFDGAGHRLGHGNGHIDRLYAAAASCRKIGVAFAWQVLDSVPCEPHDIAMDVIVSG